MFSSRSVFPILFIKHFLGFDCFVFCCFFMGFFWGVWFWMLVYVFKFLNWSIRLFKLFYSRYSVHNDRSAIFKVLIILYMGHTLVHLLLCTINLLFFSMKKHRVNIIIRFDFFWICQYIAKIWTYYCS